MVADAGSSLVVDPLVPRTLELHQWFHKSLAVNEDAAEEMDTSGESILNRGSMLVSLTAAEEDAYPMNSQPRGQALIINVMDFADEPGIRRGGSEKDADGLKELLEDYLDFQVNVPNSENNFICCFNYVLCGFLNYLPIPSRWSRAPTSVSARCWTSWRSSPAATSTC